ncbi:MAG: mandelate racemase/muconate lactonizing enzyme family protein [Spirochaetaceae bacterium]|nr:MAG: mandelate racemase/muconate lactonizing enzyme family protein [Spirochaetaceae bacterium]
MELSMRITGIEPVAVRVNRRGDWVFVLVHTDEGLTGLGEAGQSGNDALLVAFLKEFSAQLVGQDPLAINRLRQNLARVDGGRIARTALSAVEQALWDIVGQYAGVPIHALFGGKVRDRLRLYANINRHVADRSPEGFARAAKQAVDEGFTAIKLAPFDELRERDHVRTGAQAAWRPGVARVEAVRRAVGDAVDLMVDCHARMETSEAITVGRAMVDCDLMWYEEPVKHTFPDQLARISQAVPMPTASAESIFGVEGFRPFLLERVVDVLMPDVKHCGGLAEMRAIAEAAGLCNLLIAPHNPSGPVATAASAHAVCTIPNFLILEYAWGEVDWRAELTEPGEAIRDGYLSVSDAPGLGYHLNPDVVAAHRVP